MFRRLRALCYRNIFKHLTLRTVIGAIVVYSLLRVLRHGVMYYKNFERFYVKVGFDTICINQSSNQTSSSIILMNLVLAC